MDNIKQVIQDLAKAQQEVAAILATEGDEFKWARAQGYLSGVVATAEQKLRQHQQRHPEPPQACGEYVQITVSVPVSHLEIEGTLTNGYEPDEHFGTPCLRPVGDSEVESAELIDGVLPEGWEDVEIDLNQSALLDELIERKWPEVAA